MNIEVSVFFCYWLLFRVVFIIVSYLECSNRDLTTQKWIKIYSATCHIWNPKLRVSQKCTIIFDIVCLSVHCRGYAVPDDPNQIEFQPHRNDQSAPAVDNHGSNGKYKLNMSSLLARLSSFAAMYLPTLVNPTTWPRSEKNPNCHRGQTTSFPKTAVWNRQFRKKKSFQSN